MSSTPLPTRRRAATVALLTAVVVIALAVTLVVTRGGSDDASGPGSPVPTRPAVPTSPSPAAPLGTPLADYDTTMLTVQRAGFCDLVAVEDVEAALGGSAANARDYGNGESTAFTSEVTDIAAEHGCRWKRGSTVARAWVFAPPVSASDAKRLVAGARRADGCDVRRDAPAYGAPTVARTCPVGEGYEVSYRGLFGDAWLACSLTGPGARAATVSTAGEWCVAVAEAAAQPPA